MPSVIINVELGYFNYNAGYVYVLYEDDWMRKLIFIIQILYIHLLLTTMTCSCVYVVVLIEYSHFTWSNVFRKVLKGSLSPFIVLTKTIQRPFRT